MGNRNWEMGNKKAKADLKRKGVREKVHKVKFRLTFINCCCLNTGMT